jgi:dipeptidase D
MGKDPIVKCMHAGLECGLLYKKNPTLDIISFGPTLRGVHSPDEKLDLASTEKIFELLMKVI